MIRINLLPVRAARAQKSGKQVVALFSILLVAEIGVLLWFQGEQEAELKLVEQANAVTATKIAALRQKTSAVATLQTEKAALEQQKTVLESLAEGQTGPVKVLDELSRILTPIEDPKEKLRVEQLGWNPEWDPKRLWVDGFNEKQRAVKLRGHARSNEDLAEFLQRLSSSKHFVEINLNVSEAVELAQLSQARFVRFDLDALVLYGPADVKKLAAGTLGQARKQ